MHMRVVIFVTISQVKMKVPNQKRLYYVCFYICIFFNEDIFIMNCVILSNCVNIIITIILLY